MMQTGSSDVCRWKLRGRPGKTWWDWVTVDVQSFGMFCEDARDRCQ